MGFCKFIKKTSRDILPLFLCREVDKLEKVFKVRKLKNMAANFTQNWGVSCNANRNCVVLGNAPLIKNELKNEHIKKFLNNADVICVNGFPLMRNFFELKPKYYIYLDPAICDKEANKNDEYLIKLNQSVKSVIEKVDWKLNIILPEIARDWNVLMDIPKSNPNINLIYINTRHIDINSTPFYHAGHKNLLYKINMYSPKVQTVLVGCLYFAINVGYKSIYLMGAENSWFKYIGVDENNQLYINDKHCYDKDDKENRRYLPDMTIAEELQAEVSVFKSYEDLEDYSKYMGAKIYNATNPSAIDAFERIDLSKL